MRLLSHGYMHQFAVYEAMKSALVEESESNQRASQSAWVSMLLGGGSKIIASTITYPYQVIKSRLQQRQTLSTAMSASPNDAVIISQGYRNTWDCIASMYRQDGIRSYFRGIVPNAIKVAPGAAVTFVVYEECLKAFKLISKL